MADYTLFAGCLIIVGVLLILWRQTAAIERLAGGGRTAQERERHSSQQLVERLLEKLYSPDQLSTIRQHGEERTNQMRSDLARHREEMRLSAPREPLYRADSDLEAPEGEAAHMQ